MLEGKITKSVIVKDEKTGGTVLLGVAEYYGNKVNFKVPYNFETLDLDWFVNELRDTLARDLDLPVYRMDIDHERLVEKMYEYHKWNQKAGNA